MVTLSTNEYPIINVTTSINGIRATKYGPKIDVIAMNCKAYTIYDAAYFGANKHASIQIKVS